MPAFGKKTVKMPQDREKNNVYVPELGLTLQYNHEQ